MKKKLFISLIVFGAVSSMCFGKDKMNISTYALIQSQKSGGGVGFSFPIFQRGEFFIRNETNLNLYFSNTPLTGAVMVSLGDKLHFGTLKEINGFSFRSYGYCKLEFGPSWDSDHMAFNSAPMILELGGAGGFEFLYSEKKSFFIEFGGGAAISSFFGDIPLETFAEGGFKGGYVCITTGAKFYL